MYVDMVKVVCISVYHILSYTPKSKVFGKPNSIRSKLISHSVCDGC